MERLLPPAPGPEQSDEFGLNRAYRCFAFLGIGTFSIGLLDVLSQFETANGIVERWGLLAELAGIILALPILAGMLHATIYGIRQTAVPAPTIGLSLRSLHHLWRRIHAFHPLLGFAWQRCDESLDVARIRILYLANILISAWWSINGRRRYGSKAALRD